MSAKKAAGGAKPRRRTFRPQKPKATLSRVYYDSGRQHYWIEDGRERWMPYNETSLKRAGRIMGISPKPAEGELVSDLDLAIREVQHERNVDYAASLAGYKKGVYEIGGSRVLVVDSPLLIEGKPGDWSTLARVLDGLLADEHFEQANYLFGWLKLALESLRAGERRPGQALAIAGPRDCGKSLLQKLITVLLGGRMASPYAYMTGATPFNGELFRAEHLVVEDNAASTDIRARRNFGAFLKTITVNDGQPCFGKGRQTVNLTPFWRLSISVNSEPENLMVLPPMDDSVADKIILLKASSTPMPMPTETLQERRAFWETLVSELPAFVDFLEGWKIPEDLRGQRFGVRHFAHPDLLAALDDLAPEIQLLELVNSTLFRGSLAETWEGKANELEQRLTGGDGGSAYAARRLLGFRSACGTYLGRLALRCPERVTRRKFEGHTLWTVKPPNPVGR